VLQSSPAPTGAPGRPGAGTSAGLAAGLAVGIIVVAVAGSVAVWHYRKPLASRMRRTWARGYACVVTFIIPTQARLHGGIPLWLCPYASTLARPGVFRALSQDASESLPQRTFAIIMPPSATMSRQRATEYSGPGCSSRSGLRPRMPEGSSAQTADNSPPLQGVELASKNWVSNPLRPAEPGACAGASDWRTVHFWLCSSCVHWTVRQNTHPLSRCCPERAGFGACSGRGTRDACTRGRCSARNPSHTGALSHPA
jgi:hypothetical protein